MVARRLKDLRFGLSTLVVAVLAASPLSAGDSLPSPPASAPSASNSARLPTTGASLNPPDKVLPPNIGTSSSGPASSTAPVDLQFAPLQPTAVGSGSTAAAPASSGSSPATAGLPSSSPVSPAPAAAQPLEPIPDPVPNGGAATPTPTPSGEHHKVETASFNGVTPGVTSEEEVQKAWGSPKQMTRVNGNKVQLYSVDPFSRVEVTFSGTKVSAIVVRLDTSVPAQALAEPLKLAALRPVLISDEMGNVLGQAYPERGVLFSFEPSEQPGKASMRVNQIVVEPVSAESFALRAETYLDSQLESSAWDLENAIRLDPKYARAYWLQARVLSFLGDHGAALAAVDRALELVPNDGQYQVTRAQILGQLGRFPEGIQEARTALPNCEKRPHVQARALCLLGDLLGSGPSPDYQQALQYHTQAVTSADALAASPHPAVRRAAKEVLVDAHLGAAHDIAWGDWKEKETAVIRWLDRAKTFADDLVAREGGGEEYHFRVASRAVAAYVGLQGKVDPATWTDQAVRSGEQLIASTGDSSRKQQIQWDLGLALYDAVQIYQMRSEHDKAIRYGRQAVACLEQNASRHKNLADLYLLGRLYFRLGAIHAVAEQDHRAAIAWFEKAIPVFDKSAAQIAPQEAARLGETFVSMGVSYWEAGQRDRAVELTERGSGMIENAVKQGLAQNASLEVPLSNLATMYRQLGKTQQAEKLLEQATRGNKQTAVR